MVMEKENTVGNLSVAGNKSKEDKCDDRGCLISADEMNRSSK
jgi:hypothetical protein